MEWKWIINRLSNFSYFPSDEVCIFELVFPDIDQTTNIIFPDEFHFCMAYLTSVNCFGRFWNSSTWSSGSVFLFGANILLNKYLTRFSPISYPFISFSECLWLISCPSLHFWNFPHFFLNDLWLWCQILVSAFL